MSKKLFQEYAQGLTDEQMRQLTGVGASLRDFGEALEKEWLARNGANLNAEERKENKGAPNAVANPVIDVEIPDVLCVMLRPSPSTNNKTRGYGYANDVGLSDKVKFGNVPPSLLTEILVDKIATMLNGKVAEKALNDLRDALRNCMSIDDEGNFTFDKKKAPPLQHPVEVAEWIDSLKQEYIGSTAGATHTSMEVVPIPISPDATVEETSQTVEVVE